MIDLVLTQTNVRPIYKQKGSKTDAANYRPVSLICILARVTEKLVANQLTTYCSEYNIIPDEQLGFPEDV
jgi:hypothetical protein